MVRKRAGFVDDMIRALKARDIAVSGADRMVLSEQIVIMDLMAAADFALNPHDDLTLACLLRSPFCGLSEDDLFALAHNRQASLWQALQENQQNYNAAYQLCQWLLQKLDFLAPFDYFTQFLSMRFATEKTAYGAAIARLGYEIDDPIGEFLRLALAHEARRVPSMQIFLHELRGGAQDIKRDMEAGGAMVRIMTIHGAKGLEAPIVFLPDTCGGAQGGRTAPILTVRDELVLWRTKQDESDAYGKHLRAAEAQAASAEAQRLLYVALTRARDRLYIGGYLPAARKNIPESSWYAQIAQVLQKAANAATDDDGALIWCMDNAGEKRAGAEQNGAPTDLPALPDWAYDAVMPITGAGRDWYAPSNIAAQLSEPSLEQAGANGSPDDNNLAQIFARGNLTHKLLEILPAVPPQAQLARARAHVASAVKNLSAAFSDYFSQAEQTAIADEVMAVLYNPDFAFLFAAGSRAEVPICGVLHKTDGTALPLTGYIDRYVETDSAIVLIDYKSGGLEGYQTQMACYRALVQAAIAPSAKPIRCGLLSVRDQKLQFLSEAEMAAALAALHIAPEKARE